jgi:hypothetical protein
VQESSSLLLERTSEAFCEEVCRIFRRAAPPARSIPRVFKQPRKGLLPAFVKSVRLFQRLGRIYVDHDDGIQGLRSEEREPEG